MCGIVGIINSNGGKIDRRIISRSAKTLYKRGLDDAGVWTEDHVGLGHQRLSVLDLTPAGHQPKISPDGRYVIVHKGKIYNFRDLRQQSTSAEADWRSYSDTEVILAAYAKWGLECVKHFCGMFAFPIWDRQEKALFAVRYRMGGEPFYYHHSPACFAFASRPRALFSLYPNLSTDVDEQTLRFYLECGYIPPPYSIYNGIRKLPLAHYLLLDRHGRSAVTYVRYEDLRQDTARELQRVVPELTSMQLKYERAAEIAEEFSFTRQADRRAGVEDKRSFMRKGVVGDWHNHFSHKARKMFDQLAGNELILLGYERDNQWVNGNMKDIQAD